jgi:CheY-like chemotaxis protein
MEDSSPPESISPDTSLVLVVDDNADMLQYVTRILRERHQVIQATDGEKALEILRSRMGLRLPDLVLSDVMMPKIDGFELLRLMQADQSG